VSIVMERRKSSYTVALRRARGLERPGFGMDESPRFTRGVAVPGIPRVPV